MGLLLLLLVAVFNFPRNPAPDTKLTHRAASAKATLKIREAVVPEQWKWYQTLIC